MSIREILGDLARHSHQAKPTASYYPLVDQTISKLKSEIVGLKKNCGRYGGDYHDKDCGCDLYNSAISDVIDLLTK